MDISKLARDPEYIKSTLKQLPSGEYVTTTGCYIHVPDRYAERGLAQYGSQTYVYGVFAIIVGDKYSVFNLCGMIKLNPNRVLKENISGVDYRVLEFTKDTVVILQNEVVKKDVLMFNIMDELMFKGKVPWFIGYDDLGSLLDTAKLHAGSNISSNLTVIELLISIMARDSKDLTKFYRVSKDHTTRPVILGLANVQLIAGNVLNKLAGSRMGDGLVSALVNQTEEVGQLERLLRE